MSASGQLHFKVILSIGSPRTNLNSENFQFIFSFRKDDDLYSKFGQSFATRGSNLA